MKKLMEKRMEGLRRRCVQLQAQVGALRRDLEEANIGNIQTQLLVDATLATVAMRYGVRVCADDQAENENTEGWRLEVPDFSAREVLEKFEVRTRKDQETGAYIVGVMPREVRPALEAPSEGAETPTPESADGD